MKNRKLIFTTFALGALCVLTIWGNIVAFSEHPEDARGPASIVQTVVARSVAFEHELARRLASYSDRKTASLGRQPDLIDQIRFEVFQGKYALMLDGKSLKRAEFIDNPSTEGYPALIDDRIAFLEKYRGAIAPGGVSPVISLASLRVSGGKTIETYTVGQSKVRFVLDSLNRVLEMDSILSESESTQN